MVKELANSKIFISIVSKRQMIINKECFSILKIYRQMKYGLQQEMKIVKNALVNLCQIKTNLKNKEKK